jgi:hypothetical protein
MKNFEKYAELMLSENQSFEGFRKAFCLKHDDPRLKDMFCPPGPEDLPTPQEGYEWYYYKDSIPLSGSAYWIELNLEEKLVGNLEGGCIF